MLLGQVSGTDSECGHDISCDYTLSPPVDVSAFTSFFVGDMTPDGMVDPRFFEQGHRPDSSHCIGRAGWRR